MQIGIAYFLAPVLAIACFGCQASARVEFAMCSDDPADWDTIRLDFDRRLGFFGDTGSLVTRCGGKSACITSPFLLSVPPRLPVKPRDLVRWREDTEVFSIQLVPGADDLYRIDVAGRDRPRNALVARSGAMTIFYRTSEGVVAYRDTVSGHGWLRCEGKLTFDDVTRLSK